MPRDFCPLATRKFMLLGAKTGGKSASNQQEMNKQALKIYLVLAFKCLNEYKCVSLYKLFLHVKMWW
jgi:hypothetical protein